MVCRVSALLRSEPPSLDSPKAVWVVEQILAYTGYHSLKVDQHIQSGAQGFEDSLKELEEGLVSGKLS